MSYVRPMRFVALNGKYYFSIGRGDTYEDSESNVMQFTMEENSLTSCDSQYLSTKSVILKQYMGQIAQRKTTYENGKEINYIELYDVKTNQKSRFLSKDVKSEGGFTSIPNFAVPARTFICWFKNIRPFMTKIIRLWIWNGPPGRLRNIILTGSS